MYAALNRPFGNKIGWQLQSIVVGLDRVLNSFDRGWIELDLVMTWKVLGDELNYSCLDLGFAYRRLSSNWTAVKILGGNRFTVLNNVFSELDIKKAVRPHNLVRQRVGCAADFA